MGKDSKKSKKHKKEKKNKSKKDKKKKRHYSSSSDSSNSSEEWVEKEPDVCAKVEKATERDEWMGMESVFSGKTRSEMNESKKKDDKEDKKSILDEPGQSARELNPFWKNGGTGLPSEENNSCSKLSSRVGDGGVKWLQKALQRAKEQAEEEGRSVESVIAERYGSMDEFNDLLKEAESKSLRRDYYNKRYETKTFRSDNTDYVYKRREESSDSSYRRREESSDSSYRRKEESSDSSYRRKEESSDSSYRRKEESSDSSYKRREESSDSSYRRREKSSDSQYRRREESSDSQYRRRDDNSDSKYRRKEDTSNLRKLNFKRPDMDSIPSERESRSYQSNSSKKNWKKPGYEDSKKAELESESTVSSHREEEKTEKPGEKVHDVDEDRILTADELNDLSADILRAEIVGNTSLANELTMKLQREENKKKEALNKSSTGLTDEKGRNVRILTETDNRGFTRPAKSFEGESYSRKRKTNTHEGKERVRYFPDDDKYSLQDMFEKEKYNSQAEQDSTFYKIMKKGGLDDEAAFDAVRIDDREKEDRRSRNQAIRKYSAREKALDNCRWCISNDKKSDNTIVLVRDKVYLAVPSFQSLTERHCLIVPQNHVSCATALDEDVWSELMDLRKTLVRLLEEEDEDIIFFESALYIDRHPHMILHCVPVPKEIGDTAPIYFKKAIMECETEWSNNKKVVELAGRNVRRAVPKGLPYFAVDFGMQSGYAHVIEDKKLFPHNFGQEIIGGMLDLEHTIWRKPKRDSPENIKKKVESLKELLKE